MGRSHQKGESWRCKTEEIIESYWDSWVHKEQGKLLTFGAMPPHNRREERKDRCWSVRLVSLACESVFEVPPCTVPPLLGRLLSPEAEYWVARNKTATMNSLWVSERSWIHSTEPTPGSETVENWLSFHSPLNSRDQVWWLIRVWNDCWWNVLPY